MKQPMEVGGNQSPSAARSVAMARDVLIVDDSETIRRMVKKTMQMAGLNFGEV